MFLDIFSEDICKLIRTLAEKKKLIQPQTREIHLGLNRTATTTSNFSGLNIKKMGSGAGSNFSKNSPKLGIDLRPEVKPEPIHLTFADFCNIDFGYKSAERPPILNDFLTYMTGTKFENTVPNVIETDEKHPVIPNGTGDEEL